MINNKFYNLPYISDHVPPSITMGVKELWGLVSPTGELLPLSALAGQAVAVDLSCWVVDSQNLQLGNMVKRPHLRSVTRRSLLHVMSDFDSNKSVL